MKKQQQNELLARLQATSSKFMYLLEAFQIPSKADDTAIVNEYLLDDDGQKRRPLPKALPADEDERQARLEVMQNKISCKHLARQRKVPAEGKTARKRELLKRNLKKSLRKANMIEHKTQLVMKEEQEDSKGKLCKLDTAKTFNAEGKIVFSKIQLDEHDVKKKGVDTDAKKLLRKHINEEKELRELKESGDTEKYASIKNKRAWERATAKTEGQKLRDDPAALAKRIKKRKTQVKKSKEQWAERKQKLEHKKNQAQKKRAENIKERVDKKKNKKMQKLAKKGRIIPGF